MTIYTVDRTKKGILFDTTSGCFFDKSVYKVSTKLVRLVGTVIVKLLAATHYVMIYAFLF